MGQAAKLKRKRRELRAENARDMRALYETNSQRPEIQAIFAANAADAGLQDRWQADYAGQKARLEAAGWRQRTAGYDGLGTWDHRRRGLRLIHSVSRETDGQIWGHLSLSSRDGTLPGWYQLRDAQWLVYPGLAGVQVVAPESGHVNLAEVAHVWTCLTGGIIPDLGRYGTI
jgi:hypothetical protein